MHRDTISFMAEGEVTVKAGGVGRVGRDLLRHLFDEHCCAYLCYPGSLV